MPRQKLREGIGQALPMIGLVLFVLFIPHYALGQSIDSIVQDGADYLISRLGPALFLVGIVITGISLAVGNLGAVKKGAYVVAGGSVESLNAYDSSTVDISGGSIHWLYAVLQFHAWNSSAVDISGGSVESPSYARDSS